MKKLLALALFATVLVGCGTEGTTTEMVVADSTAVDTAVVITATATATEAVTVTVDSIISTTVTE